VTAPTPRESSSQSGPPVDTKRSRKVYVYWGIALTLLITVGLMCWFVATPYLHTRSVVLEYAAGKIEYEEAIRQLGGPQACKEKLQSFMKTEKRLPGSDSHGAEWPRMKALELLMKCVALEPESGAQQKDRE
jgi:hypothetical protein